MAHFSPEETDVNRDLSHDELNIHELMLRRSKLKSVVRTSTILAGFAMVSVPCEHHVLASPIVQVAMVEVELEDSHSNGLLIPFAIFTSFLIFVHLCSLVLATYMLPELDALSAVPHAQFMRRPGNIARGFCVKITWFLSHALGIVLFLVQFVLLAFVKFYPTNDDTEDRYLVGVAAGIVIITLTVGAAMLSMVWYYRSYVQRNLRGHQEALRAADDILQQVNANDPLQPPQRSI